jgi:hypothetical protein
MAKCDACFTFPCKNGGKCLTQPERDYQCDCAPGFHGKNCEFMIDACYGNPCRNGASCKVLEEGRFSCLCLAGFSGMRCETNIDDCDNNKCQNNATCVDLVNTYQSKCQAGFMGTFSLEFAQFRTLRFRSILRDQNSLLYRQVQPLQEQRQMRRSRHLLHLRVFTWVQGRELHHERRRL